MNDIVESLKKFSVLSFAIKIEAVLKSDWYAKVWIL